MLVQCGILFVLSWVIFTGAWKQDCEYYLTALFWIAVMCAGVFGMYYAVMYPLTQL